MVNGDYAVLAVGRWLLAVEPEAKPTTAEGNHFLNGFPRNMYGLLHLLHELVRNFHGSDKLCWFVRRPYYWRNLDQKVFPLYFSMKPKPETKLSPYLNFPKSRNL